MRWIQHNLSTKSFITRLTMVYVFCMGAICALAGTDLMIAPSDGIKNQLNGVGLWVITIGIGAVLFRIYQEGIDLYQWMERFFASRIIHPLLLIACVFHIIIYVFATELVEANIPLALFHWGVWVSAFSLVTYSAIHTHFAQSAHDTVANEQPISNKQLLQTFIIAGILGFIIGYLHPNLHVAVEQGQVLAGTIQYEITNPWYMYQAKLWNFWAQFSALGLSLGISEVSLSLIMSGIAGMLFSIGVSIIGLSIIRQTTLSLILPFIVLLFLREGGILAPIQVGYGYPLMIVGFHHTYGMLGMSYMMLVLSVLMIQKTRLGFFLLGFSLMIHPSLSIWLHLTLLVYVLLDFRHLLDWIKKGLFVLIGYSVSIGTLIWQRMSFPIPPLSFEAEQQYLDAITQNFATHGGYDLLFDTVEGRFLAVVLIACLLLLLLVSLTKPLRFGFKVIAIIIGVGVLGNLFAHLPNYLADIVTVLLPNRFLNMVAYLLVPMGIACLLAFCYRVIFTQKQLQETKLVSLGVPLLAIMLVGLSLYQYIQQYDVLYEARFGQFDSPVYTATRQSEGKLLVSPSERGFRTTMIQMVSDRPLVLNPLALDSLPYTVEASPATDVILDKLYGVDFFNAPDYLATARSGMNPQIYDLWESRTTDEWQALADEFDFTQILTHSGIDLQLPIVAQNENGITLYDIP